MLIEIITFGIVMEIYVLAFIGCMNYLSNNEIKKEKVINKLIEEGKLRFK